jgi:hypothetical protein
MTLMLVSIIMLVVGLGVVIFDFFHHTLGHYHTLGFLAAALALGIYSLVTLDDR